MQGRIASFFMTLFMALPLAAIPLMSIFGIPQIGSLASTLQDTGFLLENPDQSQLSSAVAWSADEAPAFGEAAQDESAFAPALANSMGAGISPGLSNVSLNSSASEIDAAFQAGTRTPAQSIQQPAFQSENSAFNAEGSTSRGGNLPTQGNWEQAVQQLSRFGITDYRLQPGHQAHGFHFACYAYQPEGKSASGRRAVIRFEAEAADPVQAVQATLKQVENWHQKHQLSAGAVSFH